MTMWDAVQTWLRREYKLLRDEPTWCGWGIEVRGEQQSMVAKVTEGSGPPQIILAGRVCDRHLIELVEALRYNSVADVGALVLEGDTFLLRVLLPVASATVAQVMAAVEAIAVESTRLRQLQQQPDERRAAGRTMFEYMAD